MIGLIDRDNDETVYRNAIDNVVNWCDNNFLDLNVTKTKEMIIDFRSTLYKNEKLPLVIKGKDVETVTCYKYLGCTLQDNLKWNVHIDNQIKKANKRMYHVRCLAKLKVDSKIITMFYNSVVSSVLMYAIACWFNCCTEKEKKKLNKFNKKTCRIVSPEFKSKVEKAEVVHANKCLSLTTRILNDPTHPLCDMFKLLPSGERLNMICCNTVRSKSMFVATAISLYNNRK